MVLIIFQDSKLQQPASLSNATPHTY